jgi:hypothetical protein
MSEDDRYEYSGKSMTKGETDRMSRQGGENEARDSDDYNRQMRNTFGASMTRNEMKRSAPRKMKR